MYKTKPFKNQRREEIYEKFFLWAHDFFIKQGRVNTRFFKEDIRRIFYKHANCENESDKYFYKMLRRFCTDADLQYNPGYSERIIAGRKYDLPNRDVIVLYDENQPYDHKNIRVHFLYDEYPFLRKESIYAHWDRFPKSVS